MKFTIQNPSTNAINMLRRAGYSFQHHVDGGEMSFVRPLARGGFPRFHIYSRQTEEGILISIHLDQKRETYGKDTRHHGEYEDDGALGQEVTRLKQILR